MKHWKHRFIGIISIIALALIACDDGNGKNDSIKQPQFRKATINVIIDETFKPEGYTATVQGTLLEAEWDGLATKIETAINSAINSGDFLRKYHFAMVFATLENPAVITLENTNEFTDYNSPSRYEISLNANFVRSATPNTLKNTIIEVCQYINTNYVQ